jgi:hypothetical protein
LTTKTDEEKKEGKDDEKEGDIQKQKRQSRIKKKKTY